MYVCVRVCACVFDFRHFFPSRLDFCFNISKIAVISRFRSLTVQRYSIKKRKTPYVGGTRRGYGLI
jgi:hypothetical protein